MKLDEYTSIKEKAIIYKNQIMIDCSNDFDQWFANQKDTDEQVVYRGVPEAKYKIYSSAQRYWITQELSKSGKSFDSFVESLINELKNSNNNLLLRYFKSFNVSANDFLYLSFLQHYQAPSTLIDFSYNLSKALFFCFDTMSYSPSSVDIDNYCSLYIVNSRRQGIKHELISLPDFIEQSVIAADRMLEDFKNKSPKIKVDTSQFEEEIKSLPYSKYSTAQLFFVPGIKSSQRTFTMGSIPNFVSKFFMSNLNLIAQEGAFIFYDQSTEPLEIFFNRQIRYRRPLICSLFNV